MFSLLAFEYFTPLFNVSIDDFEQKNVSGIAPFLDSPFNKVTDPELATILTF